MRRRKTSPLIFTDSHSFGGEFVRHGRIRLRRKQKETKKTKKRMLRRFYAAGIPLQKNAATVLPNREISTPFEPRTCAPHPIGPGVSTAGVLSVLTCSSIHRVIIYLRSVLLQVLNRLRMRLWRRLSVEDCGI